MNESERKQYLRSFSNRWLELFSLQLGGYIENLVERDYYFEYYEFGMLRCEKFI